MPYPGQVTREQIIERAHAIVEARGIDALSLGKLAKELGVKAPSLYRYVSSKEQLVQAVNMLTLQGLMAALASAQSAENVTSPTQALLAIARTYRNYGLAHPNTYNLYSTSRPNSGRPDEDVLLQMVLPIQALMAQVSGEADSLTALRGLLAQVHGFILLELNEQFQRGGDLASVFERSIVAYLHGWRGH